MKNQFFEHPILNAPTDTLPSLGTWRQRVNVAINERSFNMKNILKMQLFGISKQLQMQRILKDKPWH